MGSATFYPAANGDDGHWSVDASTFSNTGNACFFANQSLVGIFNAFVRFPNVTIPKGSTIDVCTLTLPGYVYIGQVDFLTYYNDVGNAVAPTSIEEGEALSLTDGVADSKEWDGVEVVAGTETILEAVIGRSDWASGNAIMVILKDNDSEKDGRFLAYDYGDDTAELYVEWTEPTGFRPIISTIF